MSDDHDRPEKGPAARVKALEEMLVRAGLVDPAALDELEQTFEQRVGPHHGARMVAKSWLDPGYRERLLADGAAAAIELGFAVPEGRLTAVENTSRVHNLIVCTLCSCYPWFLLGPPPAWYKSFAYRSRAVRDPRGVLRDFGTVLPDNIEVRVWDSTAEQRYMVIPVRPAGTENLSEEDLAALVTRDSMVGVEILGSGYIQEESK
ncbi:MAG: nitrile hydratase subunit alpha [Deltaproteobacteria bacterium]|nr:nitrile hydratase subunit alpha [Deltaproteobacteria bacterium]